MPSHEWCGGRRPEVDQQVSASLVFPSRYEAIHCLGAGGGGEVWAVRDRVNQVPLALKVLAEDASEHEMTALVREAIALSGLEGLGVPRVMRFGRLPGSRRPYMVRELVEGTSLERLMDGGASSQQVLGALIRAAEQLTLVHRAGFFHGDVKPANVIVGDEGQSTLVDLGLAAPWRDAGAAAAGLTPRYAAPELLAGKSLTVRAEVYALGVALREAVERGGESLNAALVAELLKVAQRATAVEPGERFPSADEFASALRRASGVSADEHAGFDPTLIWPVVGIEATANRLFTAAIRLGPGRVLALRGDSGSGRSVLLRRLAWSLGVDGRPLVWIDEYLTADADAVKSELNAYHHAAQLTILVDDADLLEPSIRDSVSAATSSGACVVSVGEESFGAEVEPFPIPALSEHTAAEILKRAVPSLTEAMAGKLYSAARGLPGELKRIVALLARNTVVSTEDVDRLLFGLDDDASAEELEVDALDRAIHLLDRGRYNSAEKVLATVTTGDPLVLAVARARLGVGLGDGQLALDELLGAQNEAKARAGSPEAKAWQVWLARAHLSKAAYRTALDLLAEVRTDRSTTGAEALAFEGLAYDHLDDERSAERSLSAAVELAKELNAPRIQGLALTCLGLMLQRRDEMDGAAKMYHEALRYAQLAGDASILGTAQLNLAVLLKVRGDIAPAIEHFEAAIDMGNRSGRRSTVRVAQLGLANLDLYLGRLSRARVAIDLLEKQRATLPAVDQAQLFGLQAELFARSGELAPSVEAYLKTAEAYEALGSGLTAAEARLESVLVAGLESQPDANALSEQVVLGRAQLGDTTAHAALVRLAEARVALVAGDENAARKALNAGLAAAGEAQHRDYVWRILATRAELEEQAGQQMMARRDRMEAVTVLEEIAASLPRDLREVFWNDSRRRDLRALVDSSLASAATQMAYEPASLESSALGTSSISAFTTTRLEQRLAHLLEINRELLSDLDLEKLLKKVISHAVQLVKAERGFVILQDRDGELHVHSSSTRAGDSEHQQFSRSIAEQVIRSREPVVSLNARDDARLRGFSSVHQMLLESVACVPIMARYSEPIGALYVETRHQPGKGFQREVPTLLAFADQVALAIETARLVAENRKRADELEVANSELRAAQDNLKELLGERTARLKLARKKLRDAQDALYGHFGYQGMVGTCEPMRRVYSLIDRIKDTDVPVLITGESGTGKEVAARGIHRASARGKGPFLGVNCGAIPEHLLESELFGHVRGAFTGADKDRKGIFREAEGGTVLLDEIGEMPQKMQAGLLRVLQERKVRPVGGAHELAVDCRFIFATHRNLEALVRQCKFREDLYYRIHVVEVGLPPLRERLDDIPLLVDHFLGIFAARYKRERKSVGRLALRRLMSYGWPGNVRQLEHVLLNAWILGENFEIEVGDLELPGDVRRSYDEPDPHEPEPSKPSVGKTTGLERRSESAKAPASQVPDSKRETLSQHRRGEKERIIEALEACNWNRVKAAELSGIPRRTFYRRLREYNIQ